MGEGTRARKKERKEGIAGGAGLARNPRSERTHLNANTCLKSFARPPFSLTFNLFSAGLQRRRISVVPRHPLQETLCVIFTPTAADNTSSRWRPCHYGLNYPSKSALMPNFALMLQQTLQNLMIFFLFLFFHPPPPPFLPSCVIFGLITFHAALYQCQPALEGVV